jgi:prephenate dehydratase
MAVVATLGPSQTISERAAHAYAAGRADNSSVQLYPAFRRVFGAVENECEYGVLPIENMVDGYVQPVLDLLLRSDLSIVDELIVPIHFAFVARCERLEDVSTVYAQFVTQGQCSEFLERLPPSARIVTTESNGESLEQAQRGNTGVGAIVPEFAVVAGAFPLTVRNVNDYQNNRTRFIVIGREEAAYDAAKEYKTSLVIVEGMDRPGMLADILHAFSSRGINLVSIMSRPTKESLGRYHFFMDIMGHCSMPHVVDAMAEVQRHNFVRSLGSYPRAKL